MSADPPDAPPEPDASPKEENSLPKEESSLPKEESSLPKEESSPPKEEGSPSKEEGSPSKEEAGLAPLPPPPRYRRFAPLILLAGAIGAGAALLPHLPKERKVELRLEDTAGIVEVDLTLSRSSDGEQVHGGAWHFAPGTAPTSLRTPMSLAAGRYEVDILIDRPPDRRTIHRVISLDDGDEITIPVR